VSGFADNDAGGITTYSVAGAKFGYDLLWVLLISQIVLFFTQEVGARLGLATGQGLAGLVREKYGVRWATFMISAMLVANVGSIVAEFAGCSAAVTLLGFDSRLGALIAAVVVVVLLTRGSYKWVQYIFVAVGIGVSIAYFVSAMLAHPDWGLAASSLVIPRLATFAGLLGRGGGDRRNHDHAVGPGLHPVLRRGQAARPGGSGRRADRRWFRGAAHEPDRRLHRRRLRRGGLLGRHESRHELAGRRRARSPGP
jgi:uncharacterized membrane protein